MANFTNVKIALSSIYIGKVCGMKMPAAARADGFDLAFLGEATQIGLSLSTDTVSVAGIFKWQTSQM